jgi:AsmA protein
MPIAAQQSKILFGPPMPGGGQMPSQGHKDLKSVSARLHPSGDFLSATEAYGAKCHHL